MAVVTMTSPRGYLGDGASTKCFALVRRNASSRSGDFQALPVHQNQHLLVQRDTGKLGQQSSGSLSGGQMTFTRTSGTRACADGQNPTDLLNLSVPWTLGLEEEGLGNRTARELLALLLTSSLPVSLHNSKAQTTGASKPSRSVIN